MRTRDENKETAILQEALEMIVREGFDGLSMQKLAKAACVSPATIYIYFKDREDLILQLYKREVEKYFTYILTDFDPEMSFADGLRMQWKNRKAYILNNPSAGSFIEQMAYTPLHHQSISMLDPKVRQMMIHFKQKAIRNKELAEMHFEVYWSLAFAPLMHLVQAHRLGRSHNGEPFVLTDDLFETALKGVLKSLQP